MLRKLWNFGREHHGNPPPEILKFTRLAAVAAAFGLITALSSANLRAAEDPGVPTPEDPVITVTDIGITAQSTAQQNAVQKKFEQAAIGKMQANGQVSANAPDEATLAAFKKTNGQNLVIAKNGGNGFVNDVGRSL